MPDLNHARGAVLRGMRICRRRGRPTPGQALYVGRPTMWANPFTGRASGHAKSVILHQRWLRNDLGALTLERMGFHPAEIDSLDRLRCRVFERMPQLVGRDLACWCPLNSRWCHADTLLDMAAACAWRIAA